MQENLLTPTGFAAFFKAIWGYPPFPWQERLLVRLATGKDPHHDHDGDPGIWPDVLDLPTGSGKTAALDIAVFHLALEAGKGEVRRAPLRIAFVVDRRLIVDDVYARAECLADALRWAVLSDSDAKDEGEYLIKHHPERVETFKRIRHRDASIVKQVAMRLREFAGDDQPPLLARSLRGGAPLEDDWTHTPAQPTILCSTVDQVGSRLLFRGYGVSDRMKPIHAGLLGSDCLILLDEAHLSEPFRQTLASIEELRRAPRESAPFGFAVLTATPSIEPKRSFGLGADDRANSVLSRRIEAKKEARLIEITGKQGVDNESRRVDEVVSETKAMLANLQDEMKASYPAIGVVLNRVARARRVFEQLKLDFGVKHDASDPVELVLLIGPARAVDRDRLAEWLKPIRTGNDDQRRGMLKPLIVVATQTIEAGVDIDFDGLVTEAAAVDALRQRFGRLNRAGRETPTKAVVLAHKDDIGPKADDPVYGDRIRVTWNALQEWSQGSLQFDFGVQAADEILKKEPDRIAGLVAPTEDAPVLMPAYLDLWSQTSPIPKADPDVALFLHGPNRSPASVQIVWRADIREHDDLQAARRHESDRERLAELFTLVPPRAAEAIEVPLWVARAFLRKDREETSRLSDIAEREPDSSNEGFGRPAFRWAGKDSNRTHVVYPSELNPGDLIVVPATYGGCDEWGWNTASDSPVTDLANAALWPYRARRFVVRVTPELIAQEFRHERTDKDDTSFDVAAIGHATKLIEGLGDHVEDSPKQLLAAVLDLELPRGLATGLSMLQDQRRLVCEFAYGETARGIVFIAPTGLSAHPDANRLSGRPSTEAEQMGSVSGRSIQLVDHCQHVRAWADEFADRAGMPIELRRDVALGAGLHDLGKADRRYQIYLAGGNPYGPASELLAKSGQSRLPNDAWERARLPENWRHEGQSVRLAAIHPLFSQAHDPKLVLWLIGTHHGLGRPLFSHTDAGRGPQSLAFDYDGLDWAGVFERLKRDYGVWGLARLESFVRLADHRASEYLRSPNVEPEVDVRVTNDQLRDGMARLAAEAPTTIDCQQRLEGLEPDNLLAFLALLGLLRALETARPQWHPRAGWDVENLPLRPLLFLAQPQRHEQVCEAAAEGVSELLAFHDFDEATDIKLEVKVARALCQSAVKQAQQGKLYFADLCAALFSDAVTDEQKSRIEPTYLAYPSVATSNFLKGFTTISHLEMPEQRRRDPFYPDSAAHCILQALFMPWNRLDRPVGLRWDPEEARRHALQWRAPTKDPPTTQHGANRLAIVGLSTLTAAPIALGGRRRLSILGADGSGDRFSMSWPIWTDPASLAAIRAMLSHPQLLLPGALGHLSVDHVRVARRISLDRLRNFSSAAPLNEMPLSA